MPASRPKKKLKRHGPTGPSTASPTTRASLTSLPIEILAEVLLYTCSPPTVLAVSRICSFLYHTLAQNPAASFIWRGVRKTCKPLPLPDPGDQWKKTEADYAAFLFSGGVCEVCRRHTRAMYVSFAIQVRLCGSWHCRRKFLNESLIDVSIMSLPEQFGGILRVESNQCFRNPPVVRQWPYLYNVWLRKSDWEKYELEINAYLAGSDSHSVEDESNKLIRERWMSAQMFPVIMQLSVKLNTWKVDYDREYERIKNCNQIWTKNFAQCKGFVLEDLLASQAYGSLQGRKNFLLEEIEARDVVPIRHTIESELLAIQARRKRQKSEAAYKEKLGDLKKIYERMRCGTLEKTHTGTSDTCEALIFPPLSIFCTLPSVRVLKGSPDPSAVPPNVSTSRDIKSSSLATSLIVADIHKWLVPVQTRLMRLLGHPNGWQSASTLTLPPLKRLTARFFCRRCGEGKVGRGYQRELCLDFKGVCSHVCAATQRKSIERPQQEAPREDEDEVADADDVNGQGKGKGRGKKSSVKTPDWAVDVFEKDEKAIRLIKIVLELANLSEEDPLAAHYLKAPGSIMRCTTCKGWITMDFETAIGHAHRHETMQVQSFSNWVPALVTLVQKDSKDNRMIPGSQLLKFERGNCELLLGPSYRARSLCKKVNYGCKHCFIVVHLEERVKVNGPRVMTFHGLRSHLKEKHNIEDIRDEDFFCLSSIQNTRVADVSTGHY